jgi:hypothetical protein
MWLALACGFPWGSAEPSEEGSRVELRVFLEGGPRAGGGRLVVQAEYDPAGELVLPEPVGRVPNSEVTLDFTPDGPPVQERIGDRNVVTQRYVFKGRKGSYEIPPLVASWKTPAAEAESQSRSVFVDIDTPPPREGELVDIVEPEPIGTFPWVVVAIVGGVFALGLFVAFRPRRARGPAVARALAPDIAALRAWERVRDDRSASIDVKAQAIARIFREYTEAVLGFDATARTTGELLEHLDSLRHLPQGNVPRARRMLRAADRVKFAEDRPAAEWIAELDADLRAFVESTKPSAWKRET